MPTIAYTSFRTTRKFFNRSLSGLMRQGWLYLCRHTGLPVRKYGIVSNFEPYAIEHSYLRHGWPSDRLRTLLATGRYGNPPGIQRHPDTHSVSSYNRSSYPRMAGLLVQLFR